MKQIFAVAALGVLMVGCQSRMTNEKAARKTLDDAGFHVTQVGGHAWFSCGNDDLWATKFQATNPNGKAVSGAVCKGPLKSSTIRFN